MPCKNDEILNSPPSTLRKARPSSRVNEKSKIMKLAIVSHDAGGAEVLSSYIRRVGICCEYVLDGPALAIFERKLGPVSMTSWADAINSCDLVLCGSSWNSDLEWRAIAEAREAGKASATFLDHWGHYRERFIRRGVQCLPDTLWVGDELAQHLAQSIFPAVPVVLVPNPYFQDIREELSKFEHLAARVVARGLRVLFVCEPLSEHGLKEYGDERHWGYTEFEALRFFFANRAVLGAPLARLTIRPHPSEARDKYDQIAREFGEVACIGGAKPLLQEIAESDVVAGCESMAMVVGLIAGRRVLSCVPPNGKACVLPHTEIESMQTLVARYA